MLKAEGNTPMKKNNKGITLVELIITFTILAVVSLMIVRFVNASANTYGRVSADVGLQYESQLAMAQLREYVIDCNGAIAFQNGTLYVLNRDDAGNLTAHLFRYVQKELYYGKTAVNDAGGYMDDAPDLLAKKVSAFSVTPQLTGEKATSVTIAVAFADAGKSYAAEETIALRNEVLYQDDFTALVAQMRGSEGE